MAINALDLSEAKAAIGTRNALAKREMALASREETLARRNFSAGHIGRTTFDWATSILSRDQKVWTDLRKLRSRSRELADNDPIMAKFLSLCSANIVGAKGVQLQAKVKLLRGEKLADTLNQQIEEEWGKWCQRGNCTIDGLLSFDELERLLARTAAMDGEFIVIMMPTENDWGFTLQLVDVDQLDPLYFDEKRGGNSFIRMGVEVDRYRKPLAYWLFTQHPNEYTTSPNARIRVEAERVIHAYRSDSAMQTRGIPWATPAMYLMNMHRGYLEAEVTAARVGACQMGIVTNEAGDDYDSDGSNEDGTVKLDAQPGGFLQLSAGQDFKSFAPQHPAAAFPAFIKEVVRRIAAALGVSYNSLAEDLEGVNFSSIRAGLLNERDTWRVRQKWMIESFHKRVFSAWLSSAVLSGRIDLSVRDEEDVAAQMVWHPRGWPWVDPLKDSQSSAEDVQNGFTSRARVLAERGLDLEDVLNELKAEEELIKSLGLKLGTDTKGDALAPEDSEEGSDAEAQQAAGDDEKPGSPPTATTSAKPKPKK